MEKEQKLFDCCERFYRPGVYDIDVEFERAKEILKGSKASGMDVNAWAIEEDEWAETILAKTMISFDLYSMKLMKCILSHPEVDVNCVDFRGRTPFYDACDYGNLEAVIVLLADERVDTEKGGYEGPRSPFWASCRNGRFNVTEHLLMHTEVDFSDTSQLDENLMNWAYSAHVSARNLLADFYIDKEIARRNLKVKRGIGQCHLSAHMFILVCLYSSGYLKITGSSGFLHILSKLPTELQMIICNRCVGIFKTDFVSSELISLELRRFCQEDK